MTSTDFIKFMFFKCGHGDGSICWNTNDDNENEIWLTIPVTINKIKINYRNKFKKNDINLTFSMVRIYKHILKCIEDKAFYLHMSNENKITFHGRDYDGVDPFSLDIGVIDFELHGVIHDETHDAATHIKKKHKSK
jgi:hypothetical protein